MNFFHVLAGCLSLDWQIADGWVVKFNDIIVSPVTLPTQKVFNFEECQNDQCTAVTSCSVNYWYLNWITAIIVYRDHDSYTRKHCKCLFSSLLMGDNKLTLHYSLKLTFYLKSLLWPGYLSLLKCLRAQRLLSKVVIILPFSLCHSSVSVSASFDPHSVCQPLIIILSSFLIKL